MSVEWQLNCSHSRIAILDSADIAEDAWLLDHIVWWYYDQRTLQGYANIEDNGDFKESAGRIETSPSSWPDRLRKGAHTVLQRTPWGLSPNERFVFLKKGELKTAFCFFTAERQTDSQDKNVVPTTVSSSSFWGSHRNPDHPQLPVQRVQLQFLHPLVVEPSIVVWRTDQLGKNLTNSFCNPLSIWQSCTDKQIFCTCCLNNSMILLGVLLSWRLQCNGKTKQEGQVLLFAHKKAHDFTKKQWGPDTQEWSQNSDSCDS